MADPVTLAEAKAWAKVEISDDDDLITALITTATTWMERATNRKFIDAADLVERFDRFFNEMQLPLSPLDSVTTVQYIDSNGDLQTLSNTVYDVDTSVEPGVVRLGFNQVWPITRTTPNAVIITYKVGYGATAADTPEELKSAIKMLVAHWYEHREAATDGREVKTIPFAVESVIWSYKVPTAAS